MRRTVLSIVKMLARVERDLTAHERRLWDSGRHALPQPCDQFFAATRITTMIVDASALLAILLEAVVRARAIESSAVRR